MNAMPTIRPEVPTHPLIEHVFAYARINWEGNSGVYWEEMPKLMQLICELCSDRPRSASNVYYALRDNNELTALECLHDKNHKIVVLSRLMTVMANRSILGQEKLQPEDLARHPFVVYTALPPFIAEAQ